MRSKAGNGAFSLPVSSCAVSANRAGMSPEKPVVARMAPAMRWLSPARSRRTTPAPRRHGHVHGHADKGDACIKVTMLKLQVVVEGLSGIDKDKIIVPRRKRRRSVPFRRRCGEDSRLRFKATVKKG